MILSLDLFPKNYEYPRAKIIGLQLEISVKKHVSINVAF